MDEGGWRRTCQDLGIRARDKMGVVLRATLGLLMTFYDDPIASAEQSVYE